MTLNIRTVCASILNKNVDYISGHRYDPKYKDFLYINTELKRWSYFGRVIYFQAVRSRNKGVVQREVKYRDGRYVVVDQTLERNYRQKAFLWKLRESTSAARGCSQLSSRGWKRRIPEIKNMTVGTLACWTLKTLYALILCCWCLSNTEQTIHILHIGFRPT